MYSLLRPTRGLIISNSFFFQIQDDPEIAIEDILASTNATSLFAYRGGHRWDSIDFLLMRKDEHELEIPLEYHEVYRGERGSGNNASGMHQIFKPGDITRFNKETKFFSLELSIPGAFFALKTQQKVPLCINNMSFQIYKTTGANSCKSVMPDVFLK